MSERVLRVTDSKRSTFVFRFSLMRIVMFGMCHYVVGGEVDAGGMKGRARCGAMYCPKKGKRALITAR